tara:strand:- start:1654 stop:1893 length:240 start_codon:yes stop_codon:yes gene_type:complete
LNISYTVKRGKAAGTVLVPHRHSDGKFVASPDRFARNYRRYDTAEAAFRAAEQNDWSIRMAPASGGAASLIRPAGCEVS